MIQVCHDRQLFRDSLGKGVMRTVSDVQVLVLGCLVDSRKLLKGRERRTVKIEPQIAHLPASGLAFDSRRSVAFALCQGTASGQATSRRDRHLFCRHQWQRRVIGNEAAALGDR